MTKPPLTLHLAAPRGFDMHLGHQGAGGVHLDHVARGGLGGDGLGDAMS